MRKSNKKGFTVVELVIVIAIIAILAAVLIPTFAGLIQKANESKDTQLVKNLNTALAVDNKEHKTMTSALEAAAAFGYDVGKINASATGNEILWDSKNDVFCYYNKSESKIQYIPNFEPAAGKTPATYQLWKIYDGKNGNTVPAYDSQTYSIYWAGEDAPSVTEVKVGFDVGNCPVAFDLTYKNTGSKQDDVVIRTNSGKLTINAPLDTVCHYNSARAIDIVAVAPSSYHEFGVVDGFISIKEGHLVLENGSDVMFVNINASNETELAKISVTLEPGSSYSYVTTTNDDLIEQAIGVIDNKTNDETIKTIVNINDSTVAFIKDGTEVTSYTKITDAIKDFKNKEGATLELLDNIVNIDTTSSNAIRINMPANGTIDGHGKMIYGNVSVHVNPAGGSIYNTQFKYIHNNKSASQSDCDWYGWISKEGTLTAIYASNLTGKLVVDGCLFDNMDWECIQTTPKKDATIEITNNTFMHSDKTAYSQLRYIHIQAGSYNTAATVTITGNKFYKTKNTTADTITNIGCWYVKPSAQSDFTGNYFEYDPSSGMIGTNSEVSTSGSFSADGFRKLFPARASANEVTNDLMPVAQSGDVAYLTLQKAVDSASSVTLLKDNSENVTIPVGKSFTLYTGSFKMSGTVTNNGTLNITSGSAIDPTKITNGANGKVIISGGTFTTQPQSDWIAEWYTAVANEDGSFTVRLMNDEEAIAAGAVVRYGKATSSSRKYFKTLQEGIQKGIVYLLTDISGTFTKNATIDIYCGEFTLTGSLLCPGKTLYIDDGKAILDRIECGKFYGGYSSGIANITVKDGTATDIRVAKNATVVIEGGNYTGAITVTSGGTGSLTIKGGTFSVDPSAYVNAETHTVTNNGNGTWTVTQK